MQIFQTYIKEDNLGIEVGIKQKTEKKIFSIGVLNDKRANSNLKSHF